MEQLKLSSGLKELTVIMDGRDTGRKISFNPADQGFAEELYSLVHRIGQIHKDREAERTAQTDVLKKFEINRAEDKEMREAVDLLFGDGFCDAVFQVRLFAVTDGLTVIETFLFSVMDEMDTAITETMARRSEKIQKYTNKYKKYTR